MKISSVQYKSSFNGVYALVGSREQIKEATNSLINAKGESLSLPATSIYRNKKIKSPISDYVESGNSITFVVTGHEDVKKLSSNAPGWKTLEDLSKHIDRYIILKDIAKQMREVRKSMFK